MVDYSKGPLLPLTIGSHWTYRVTDGDKIEEKTLTAEGEELVGGTGPHAVNTAVKLVADRGKELTYSWVAAEGDKVVRYREEVVVAKTLAVVTEDVWDPYRLYVDGSTEHRVEGASWLEEHSEVSTKEGVSATTDVRERWTVVSGRRVGHGARGYLHGRGVPESRHHKAQEILVRTGVGKVKETGGQTEELSDFEIAD